MNTYINMNEHNSFSQFVKNFEDILKLKLQEGYDSIAFVCIGSDRSTGDSLGPIIGYKLSNAKYDNIHIFGSLDNPVHAKNLAETLYNIYQTISNPLIIAIDACLGNMEHVGFIGISDNPLKPGAGVNKDLPEVGDISIIGIVNFGGFMDFIMLQNTRLNLVMKMADTISLGIKYVLSRLSTSQDFVYNTAKSPFSKQAILK